VTSSEPLRQALREGKVGEATPLLVMDKASGRLALSVE